MVSPARAPHNAHRHETTNKTCFMHDALLYVYLHPIAIPFTEKRDVSAVMEAVRPRSKGKGKKKTKHASEGTVALVHL